MFGKLLKSRCSCFVEDKSTMTRAST
uniref:Uncharacterized protein n=1 Tax=Arundo donax TaxID=35708 RepID=A0A0A9EL27_ARUDO